MEQEQNALLELKNLSVRYADGSDSVLQGISLSLHAGEIICVIGESGSGKSTLFQSILQLQDRVMVTEGSVVFRGEVLCEASARESMARKSRRFPGVAPVVGMQSRLSVRSFWGRNPSKLVTRRLSSIRGTGIGVVFQEPGASLDPTRRIWRQFYDAMHAHDKSVRKMDARSKAEQLLKQMEFSDPDRILDSYPVQLSGGMNQRVAIVLAMALKPDVLLADEPTSALDVTVQAQVIKELMELRRQYNTAILLITHNMGVAAKMADRIVVMKRGQIVECGTREEVLKHPKHPYTRKLLEAVPKIAKMKSENILQSDMEPILEVSHITKTFHEHGGRQFRAVNDISLTVREGECVGIVGESGSGKSTLARMVTRLLLPDSGSVKLCGTELTTAKGASLCAAYRNIKMIFQEPRSSFDPRLTLGESICEALEPVMPGKKARMEEAGRLLCSVSLDESFLDLYPGQVSGGECQRAAIARALAQKPKLLICDEATSALDVSVQAQIIVLLNEIRQNQQLSILLISHDLALVSSFCDRLYVLYEGTVAEEGETAQVIQNPRQPYTKKLIDSVLSI